MHGLERQSSVKRSTARAGGSQLPVTPAPGNQTPSAGLCQHLHMYTEYTRLLTGVLLFNRLVEKRTRAPETVTHLEECEGGCSQGQTRACKGHSYQTKESISARVGLGRKRHLHNITEGQFCLAPTHLTVASRKAKPC